MSVITVGEASILRLSAVKHDEHSPTPKLTFDFGPDGGTVGRRGCTWTLKDTKGVLSRKHFEIRFHIDHYVLIDLSTNGTFINGSSQKLGPGLEHRIVDGDRIEIGEYLLQVSLIPESREFSGEIAQDAVVTTTDIDAASEPSVPSLTEPAFGENIDIGDESAGFAKPPSWADEADGHGEPISSFFPANSVHSDNKADAPILNHHMPPPRSVEQHPATPQSEEAAASALDHPPTSFIPGGNEFQTFDEPPAIPDRPAQPDIDKAQPDSDRQEKHEIAKENQNTDSPTDQEGQFAVAADEIRTQTQSLGVRQERHLSSHPPASPTDNNSLKKTIASEAPGHDEAALFRAYLEGLGVPDWEVPEASREVYMRMMGEALQKAIQGLIQSLHLRDEFKNEFIVPGTVMGSMQNNPFKYSVNAEDALSRAFLKSASKAYLPIVEAIQQSFEDIAAHHLALVAGMQAAVSGLLGLFSPAELEKRMSSVSLMDRVMPQLKHARLWETYLQEYQEIAEKAEEDFQDLLGKKFAKAYNDQVMALNLAEFGKAKKDK